MWHDYWFSGKSCTIWIAKALMIVLLYNFGMICITDRNYSVFIRLIFNHDSLRSKHKCFLSCCKLHWVRFIEIKKWIRLIESEKFNSNRENIKVYEVNLDIFSIANDFFIFNEPASEHRQNHSNRCKLVLWKVNCDLSCVQI